MVETDLNEQTKLAFEYIQKLYLEVSYLIKEIEGLLAEEPEKFVIAKSGGYAITSRSSSGLETNNVFLWPLRKFSVSFIPEEYTTLQSGMTITRFVDDLKVFYLRIVLDDKELTEPTIYSGMLYDFQKKSPKGKYPVKFESLLAFIEYNENKVFPTLDTLVVDDTRIKFSGKLFTVPLFEITDSQQISNRIINPCLEIFRA